MVKESFMKKLFGCILVLFSAGALWAENSISMVTYFPVPYVAYNRVNPGSGEHNEIDEMAIGVTKKGGHLSLGSANLSDKPLDAAKTTLFGGNLLLNFSSSTVTNKRFVQVAGTELGDGTISVGDDSVPTTTSAERLPVTANLSFGNLHIKQIGASSGNDPAPRSVNGFSSLNTKKLEVDNLSLFTKNFPSCYEANTELENRGQIAWTLKRLEGSDEARLYLTCGKVLTCPGDPEMQELPCTVDDYSERMGRPASGRGMACGKKTRTQVCTDPPVWGGWSDWNLESCGLVSETRVDGESCSNYINRNIRSYEPEQWLSIAIGGPTQWADDIGDTFTGHVKTVTRVSRGPDGECETTVSSDYTECTGVVSLPCKGPAECTGGNGTLGVAVDASGNVTITPSSSGCKYYRWAYVSGNVSAGSGYHNCPASGLDSECRTLPWFQNQYCGSGSYTNGSFINVYYRANGSYQTSSGNLAYTYIATKFRCDEIVDRNLAITVNNGVEKCIHRNQY